MTDLRISRRQVLQGIGAVGALGALGVPTAVFADEGDEEEETRVRWDIVQNTPNVVAGGQASAKASDGSMITMTGSGTFVPGDPDEVTGGGTWMTSNAAGASTESGTYQVTRLVSFTEEPLGALPSGTVDTIDELTDARAGLAVFRIAYSNGSDGVLVFSCMLPGSPDSVLEGITATMGHVDFWNSVIAPITIFHIMREDDN
jgi:hypothetical protein